MQQYARLLLDVSFSACHLLSHMSVLLFVIFMPVYLRFSLALSEERVPECLWDLNWDDHCNQQMNRFRFWN